MIIQCCVCKKRLGTKPPYDDHSVTHTYCPDCLAKTRREWEAWKKENAKKNPRRKKRSTTRRRSNPSTSVVVGEIPGRIEEIRYVRQGPQVSKKMQGPYKHRFTSAGTKMLALRDGSILIRNPKRKLWLRNNAD